MKHCLYGHRLSALTPFLTYLVDRWSVGEAAIMKGLKFGSQFFTEDVGEYKST